MTFHSRKEIHDFNTPSDSSNRQPTNRTLNRRYSIKSISNSSVHTTSTVATREDLFDFPEQGPGGFPSTSHRKSFHSLEKTTFRLRNESTDTIHEAGSVRSSTATSTSQEIRSLNIPSFEDEDESPLPSAPRPSVHNPSTLPVLEPSPILSGTVTIQDKAGRRNWNEYSPSSSSGSQPSTQVNTVRPPAKTFSSSPSAPTAVYHQHAHSTGFVPSAETHAQITAPPIVESSPQSTSIAPTSSSSSTTQGYAVTRVRALRSFKPTEPNELAFEKGNVIKVLNREYKDWWRGQTRGRTGIFPVNYVEFLPEPSPAELVAEAQQETAVFSQAASVDRLLKMVRALGPGEDNLADNEEIQELYRSYISFRPKILKLIDKYSQKRADLVWMDESFVEARTIIDRGMDESFARHSESSEQDRPPSPPPYPRPGPEPRVPQQQAPDPSANLGQSPSYRTGQFQSQPRAPVQPPSQQAQQAPQLQPRVAYSQPYSAQDNLKVPYNPQARPQQAEAPPQPEQTQAPSRPQTQQRPQVQLQLHPQPQHSPQHPQVPAQTQPRLHPSNALQLRFSAHAESHSPVKAHSSVQPQSQAQAQVQEGPPFVFDPNATYPHQNAQAWAQYYAQGGTDPNGLVYFFSVPGFTDGA